MTTPPLKDPTSVQWSIIDETSVHWHLLKQELGHGFSTWVLTSWHLSSISLNGRSHFFKRKVTFFTRKVKTSRLRRKLIPSFASVFSFWIRETSFKNFVWFKEGMRATICIASLSLLWPETQTLSRKLVLHKPAQQVVSSKPIHSLGEKIWQIHSGSFFFAMCVVRDATAASRHWWADAIVFLVQCRGRCQ